MKPVTSWPQPRRWLTLRQLPQRPPAEVLFWLRLTGSLTAALDAQAQGRLQVRLLHQGWQRPAPAEAQQLRLPLREQVWVREVELTVDDTAWVQARSLLPRRSLRGIGRRITRLGNRSLGSLLFRHPDLKREALTLARLHDHPAGTVWARRSCLRLHGHPVFVAEAFLPALFASHPNSLE